MPPGRPPSRRPSGRPISRTANANRSTLPARSSRTARCCWCASPTSRSCRKAPTPRFPERPAARWPAAGSSQLGGDLARRVQPCLGDPLQLVPTAVRCRLGDPTARVRCAAAPPARRRAGDRAGARRPAGRLLRAASKRRCRPSSAPIRCARSATRPPRIFRDLTGYDRVMVYRFDDDGHGEVFSEQRRPDLEAFLGNRYPASDIPQIARRLYERNRVRVLVDVRLRSRCRWPPRCRRSAAPSSTCRCASCAACRRSMSSTCRTWACPPRWSSRWWSAAGCGAWSPATITRPRFVHFEVRAVCELLAEAVATRIAALESFAQGAGRAVGAPAGAAHDRGDLARGRLAQRAVRQLAVAAAAGRRQRRGAAVRGPGADRRRGAGHPATARTRRLAGRAGRARRCSPPPRSASTRRNSGRSPPPPAACWPPPVSQRARRIPDVVPPGAGAHRHLGRQPVQAGAGRRRPAHAVAAPVVRAVAPAGRGHQRAVDAGRPGRRPG